MSRDNLLLAVPLVWVGLFVAGASVVADTAAYPVYIRVEIELAKLVSMVGSLIGASVFARGEHMRRAWLWMAMCMATLLVRDAIVLLELLTPGTALHSVVSAGLVLVANVAAVASVWLFARAFRVGALVLPGTQFSRTLVVIVATALALVAAGPAALMRIDGALAGDWNEVTWLISSFGDIISFILIAPLFLTALALRGGMLGRVWTYLTLSLIGWLSYDGIYFYGATFGLTEAGVAFGTEICRAFACSLGFIAGVSQRWSVLRIRRGGAAKS